MLQNVSIKTKMGAILLLPLLSLGVLAGMRAGDSLARGHQADRVHNITTFAVSLSGLVHELQRERDLSAGYVGSGKTSGYGRMIAQRVAVNQALKGFRGKLRRLDLHPYNQRLQARFAAAEASLARHVDDPDPYEAGLDVGLSADLRESYRLFAGRLYACFDRYAGPGGFTRIRAADPIEQVGQRVLRAADSVLAARADTRAGGRAGQPVPT